MRAILALTAAACICTASAHAQTGAKPPVQSPPTEVAPVTVYPKTDAPKITASYPAAGASIVAGVMVLSLTFDQPMIPTRYEITPAAGGETPDCLKVPRLLNDNKTFVLLCTALPGKTYSFAFNAGDKGGFANLGETRAAPASLSFTTTAGEGPQTIKAAMKAANLGDIDMPIQDDPNVETAAAKPAS